MSTALVLSAGGLWAAWQVGVWKSWCARFQPDLIVGASAGSWNGWAIASGCTPAELADLWLDPQIGRIFQFGPHPTGLLRPEMLYEKSRELFARFRPKTRFALTAVEVPRMRLHIFETREITWRHLAASCSIPFGFPPVTIEGKWYVDGGFRGALPLWAAQQLGATRAVALNVLNTALFRTLHRTMLMPRASRKLNVMRLEPSQSLGSLRGAVVWSRTNVERWIELGERDGDAAATLLETSITM